MVDMRGQVTINLSAVQQNYKLLQQIVGPNTQIAGVLKANAYGLGALPIAETLTGQGCTEFFVANVDEAIELRQVNVSCAIYTLNGYHDCYADLYIQHSITPVIDSLESLAAYQLLAQQKQQVLPVVIHVNTGMNRMGMSVNDAKAIAQSSDKLSGLDLVLVMSHLACADDKDHAQNAQQLDLFQAIDRLFPDVKASFANSSGVFLGSDYHFDLARPGMAVYGLNPTPYAKQNPMSRVLDVQIPMIGMHDMQAGDTLGYGAAFIADRQTRVAVLGAGYADGIFRSLSNKGAFYYGGQRCPIIGRVSMDMTCIDVTDLDDVPSVGAMFEYIGAHQSPADIGALAGSFDYEVITVLSRRFKRTYINQE